VQLSCSFEYIVYTRLLIELESGSVLPDRSSRFSLSIFASLKPIHFLNRGLRRIVSKMRLEIEYPHAITFRNASHEQVKSPR